MKRSWVRSLTAAFGIAAILVSVAMVGAREGAAKAQLTVRLFLSTDCPVGQSYGIRLQNLIKSYSQKDVQFEAYFPNDLETPAKVKAYLTEFQLPLEGHLDLGGVQAKMLGVNVVPTATIIGPMGKPLYIGAIDDNKNADLVKKRYLQDSLDALLAGKSVPTRKTQAFGCVLMPGEAPPAAGKATYASHTAKIINDHCIECHRPGEVAPFSLIGYENSKKWAPMIAQVAESRKMPPWKAVEGYGEFHDANRLTPLEIETLKQWNLDGAPRGDSKLEPKIPSFSSEWTLGTPDVVLEPAGDFKVKADGNDVYRNFAIKTNFTETKWVRAMDVRPGNKRVVHHVIGFLDEQGRSLARETAQKDGQPGYSSFGGVGFTPNGSLGGWAPGSRARFTPDGTAFELKPGTTIVLQVHYHPTGKPEVDRTKIGLYFAKERPKKPMQLAWLANIFFKIPPGEKAHFVRSSFVAPGDMTIYAAMPHMHLLGRSMKVEAELPTGEKIPIVYIDDWDFNWQMTYMLKQPVRIPRGTKIIVETVFDNSDSNPNQPNNPPKSVTCGEETTDEMLLLVLGITEEGNGRIPEYWIPRMMP